MSTRARVIGRLAATVLLLVALDLPVRQAIADEAKEAYAVGVFFGTGLNRNGEAPSVFGAAPSSPFFDERMSPWEMPYLSDEHGAWLFADATGRTRNYVYSGQRTGFPRSTDVNPQMLWIGNFVRTDATNPRFTVNASSMKVFAQTKGSGNLFEAWTGKAIPPYAQWYFAVRLYKVADGRRLNVPGEVFTSRAEVSGIMDDPETPMELLYAEVSDQTSGAQRGNTISEDFIRIAFSINCVPIDLELNEQCFRRAVSTEYGFPETSREIDLDAFGISIGDEYEIHYAVVTAAGEDGAEHYAEVLLGDPLDVDGASIELQTTHQPVPASGRGCDAYGDTDRFVINEDVVVDQTTGLTWQRCPLGYSVDDQATADLADDRCLANGVQTASWQSALQQAVSSRVGGFDDWTIPDAKQLDSLVVASCELPAIDNLAFPDTPPSAFWSSTPATDGDEAWQIEFFLGELQTAIKTQLAHIRPVRRGVLEPIAPRITLRAAPVSVSEDGPTVDLELTLSRPAETDVALVLGTESVSATANIDYADTIVNVTIPAGQQRLAVSFDVIDDNTPEVNEVFAVNISSDSDTVFVATTGVLVTIIDDEARLDVLAEQPDIYEGDNGSADANFLVRLSSPATSTVTADYVVTSNTATVGIDVEAAAGTVTINNGETEARIPIAIVGDTVPENDEHFAVTVTAVSGPAIARVDTATLVIVDDDTRANAVASNDSGVTYCGTDAGTLLACPQPGYPGQDAEFGRDAVFADNSDGAGGFHFTKLDAAGDPLANQDALYPYVNVPSNPQQARWDCVRDEVTGLVWEIKADQPNDVRHYDWTYTWYDSDGVGDGGDPGTENGGTCAAGLNCDTEAYVAAINATSLCGFNDWRLPRPDEFFDLAFVASATADARRGLDDGYFPHNYSTSLGGDVGDTFWTDSTLPSDPTLARGFRNKARLPEQTLLPKSSAYAIRLVRGDL
ncbi:MAG: DUF1566 domain-containing protein [Pseudomonadota bacterium]